MFATLSPKLPPGRPIPTQILNTVQVPPVVHNFEFWFRTLPCSRCLFWSCATFDTLLRSHDRWAAQIAQPA